MKSKCLVGIVEGSLGWAGILVKQVSRRLLILSTGDALLVHLRYEVQILIVETEIGQR